MVRGRVRVRLSVRVKLSSSIRPTAVEGEHHYFWCITVLSS